MKKIFDKEKMKKTVTITLTQSCNLSCRYCYEHNKSAKTMSFDLAKNIVDKELLFAKKTDEIEIDLFGGEPFLNFPLLKQIVEYIEFKYAEYNIFIFVTTNGTLLTREIKEWLVSKTHILQCGLSLDGNKQMHDYNRSNSFDSIDLEFFSKTYPEQDIKMTISEYTLNSLFDGIKFCHEKGFKIACNLAYGIDWSNENNVKVLERELMLLIEYYLKNPQIKPCSLLDDPISTIAFAENVALRTCGAGWTMVSYDVDGQSYPCQFFMPLSIGEEKAKVAQQFSFKN